MKKCSFNGCDKKYLAKGFCAGHYKQIADGKELTELRQLGKYKFCTVNGCVEKHCANSYCKKHNRIYKLYNIDPAVYEEKLLQQNNSCAICKTHELICGTLVIDHDHKCCSERSTSCGNCIRGLLCAKCNSGIGYLMESKDTLNSAIDYLNLYS